MNGSIIRFFTACYPLQFSNLTLREVDYAVGGCLGCAMLPDPLYSARSAAAISAVKKLQYTCRTAQAELRAPDLAITIKH